jgi:hypothetical protein
VFPSAQFRNGPQAIAFRVKSKGQAVLSLANINKRARLTDPPFATVSIPDTKGKWITLHAKINSDKKITGTQMVYMTLIGNNAVVDFKEIQFDPLVKD